MAEKNTLSILETIKNKMKKLDKKPQVEEEAPMDSDDEFLYISSGTNETREEQEVEDDIDFSASQQAAEAPAQEVENTEENDLPSFEDDLGLGDDDMTENNAMEMNETQSVVQENEMPKEDAMPEVDDLELDAIDLGDDQETKMEEDDDDFDFSKPPLGMENESELAMDLEANNPSENAPVDNVMNQPSEMEEKIENVLDDEDDDFDFSTPPVAEEKQTDDAIQDLDLDNLETQETLDEENDFDFLQADDVADENDADILDDLDLDLGDLEEEKEESSLEGLDDDLDDDIDALFSEEALAKEDAEENEKEEDNDELELEDDDLDLDDLDLDLDEEEELALDDDEILAEDDRENSADLDLDDLDDLDLDDLDLEDEMDQPLETEENQDDVNLDDDLFDLEDELEELEDDIEFDDVGLEDNKTEDSADLDSQDDDLDDDLNFDDEDDIFIDDSDEEEDIDDEKNLSDIQSPDAFKDSSDLSQVVSDIDSMDEIDREFAREIMSFETKMSDYSGSDYSGSDYSGSDYSGYAQNESTAQTTSNNQFDSFLDEQVSNPVSSFDSDLNTNNSQAELSKMDAVSSGIHESTIAGINQSMRTLAEAQNVVSGVESFSESDALQELATELMAPKLEQWFNENLPELVEKVVREEIKKMIPKD